LEASLQTHQIDLKLCDGQQHPKSALFVSKEHHALNEILVRINRNEVPAGSVCSVSNDENNRQFAETLHIPFYYIPSNEDKAIVERKILDVCSEHQVELIVLAKYMQILSDHFVSHYPNQIINIHHSFLPSFIGANPYKQAWERGVRLVGMLHQVC